MKTEKGDGQEEKPMEEWEGESTEKLVEGGATEQGTGKKTDSRTDGGRSQGSAKIRAMRMKSHN